MDHLEQIAAIVQACADTDGLLIVDREGIIRYRSIKINYYWKAEETVGCHILELYPELDEGSSTILRVLRTGQAIYDQRQPILRGGATHCTGRPKRGPVHSGPNRRPLPPDGGA